MNKKVNSSKRMHAVPKRIASSVAMANSHPRVLAATIKGPAKVERAIKKFYNKHGEAMSTLAYE